MTTNPTFQYRTVAAATLLVAMMIQAPAHAAGSSTFTRAGGAASTSSFTEITAATDLVVNVAGITSYDDVGASINTVLTLNALAGAVVDRVDWNLTLTTIGLSWLTEATVLITNSNGDGVYFSPGAGDDFSGSRTYTGGGSLVGAGLAFNVLADGKLYFEFFEDYDDYPGAADATFNSGTITLGGIAAVVPEPATYGLMGLGLFGVALARRRR
jgi:hypothetical protein